MRQIFTIQRAAYTRLKKHFIGIRTIQAGCADGGYRGTFRNTFDEFHNIRIDISMQIKERKGFQVLPKRWVVERTFAWLNGSRRLSKDYETSCCSAEAMIMISRCYTFKTPMNTSSHHIVFLWITAASNIEISFHVVHPVFAVIFLLLLLYHKSEVITTTL